MFSRAGSTLVDSIASRSVYSLPTITESNGSNSSTDTFAGQTCFSRQAEEVLGFSETQVTDIAGSDSVKTLGQIRTDVRRRKIGSIYKWPKQGQPNALPPSGSDERGFVFMEEMLALAPFAMVFATGPEDPLRNRHCSFCKNCTRNVSMKSKG